MALVSAAAPPRSSMSSTVDVVDGDFLAFALFDEQGRGFHFLAHDGVVGAFR
jgi:hypothetical protein